MTGARKNRTGARAGSAIDQAEHQLKALKALRTAYQVTSRALSDEIDRARNDLDRIGDLGARLRWLDERHSLVRSALVGGPAYADYLCGDCTDLPQVRSLAETAAKLARRGADVPTTLNMLNYIDHELGWAQGAP
ncbi:hypothetical protein [Dongia sp.]|uniref:hypothetical protein n=1 Tax=Dongia sp. TaxID=1977262 RepID=UPI0035B45BF9